MLVTSSSATASGVIAKSEAFWTEMVEPSGSALATSAAASAPLAPDAVDHREGAAELVGQAVWRPGG